MSAQNRYSKFMGKWGPAIMLVALAVIGPGVVDSALDERTAWRIFLVVVWAALVVLQWVELIRRPRRQSSPGRIDPSSISADEVERATSESTSRVGAVKLLRERNPGLGLKEAADLVDAQNPAP